MTTLHNWGLETDAESVSVRAAGIIKDLFLHKVCQNHWFYGCSICWDNFVWWLFTHFLAAPCCHPLLRQSLETSSILKFILAKLLKAHSCTSLLAQWSISARVGIPAAGGGWREAVQRLPPEHGVECGRAQIWEKYVSAMFLKQVSLHGDVKVAVCVYGFSWLCHGVRILTKSLQVLLQLDDVLEKSSWEGEEPVCPLPFLAFCLLHALFLPYFWAMLFSSRSRAKREGSGTPLSHTDGHQ